MAFSLWDGRPGPCRGNGPQTTPPKKCDTCHRSKKGERGTHGSEAALARWQGGRRGRHCLSQGGEGAPAFHFSGLELQGGCAIVEPLVLLPSTNRECIMNRDIAAQFIKMLTNLDQCLAKAEAHAEAKKFNVENFFNERLIVDMLPLSKQVLIC
ncbi:MAG: DUF1993 family protein, partial [Chromatiaceae bacterium]|nr:DUF1993 family protein [Chromatiaceae bacterium]